MERNLRKAEKVYSKIFKNASKYKQSSQYMKIHSKDQNFPNNFLI